MWDDLEGLLDEMMLAKEELNDIAEAAERTRPPPPPDRPANYHPQPGGVWCLEAFYELVDLVRAHVHECEKVGCTFCNDLYPAYISEPVQWYIDTGELSNWEGSFFPPGIKNLNEIKRRPT